jgi:hypothetical protein
LSLLSFAAFLYITFRLKRTFYTYGEFAWLGLALVLMIIAAPFLIRTFEIEKENRRRLATQETIARCRSLVKAARSRDASKWADEYSFRLSLDSYERIRFRG